MKGSLVAARGAMFECKRCRGEVAQPSAADLEGLAVDGETYERVESFCYLGDTLDADGGVESAVTARIRSGWTKFRELASFLTSKGPSLKMKGQVYAACVRSRMVYGSETGAMRVNQEEKLERTEMRMVRWMCGVTLRERKTSEELRRRLEVESIKEVVRRNRLRWYGHVERKDEGDWVKRSASMVVEGARSVGRPKKTWHDAVRTDMKLLGLKPTDAQDRAQWRRAIKRPKSDPAESGQAT